MAPKTVALIVAICVTLGWLLASSIAPPVARVQSLPRAARAPAAVEEPTFPAEQLHLRLQHPSPAPEGRRNPFAFSERKPANHAPAAAPASRTEPSVASADPAPATPALHLSGIGVTGDERTAVIALGADVHIVKVGDGISGYRVAEIGDTSVTLTREAERLVLRFPQ